MKNIIASGLLLAPALAFAKPLPIEDLAYMNQLYAIDCVDSAELSLPFSPIDDIIEGDCENAQHQVIECPDSAAQSPVQQQIQESQEKQGDIWIIVVKEGFKAQECGDKIVKELPGSKISSVFAALNMLAIEQPLPTEEEKNKI